MSQWSEWKKKNSRRQVVGRVGPSAFLNPDTEYAHEDLAHERYSVCEGCEHFISLTKQCKKCGCFMHLKTKLAHAECPIGKW